jgi:hypothetical protein
MRRLSCDDGIEEAVWRLAFRRMRRDEKDRKREKKGSPTSLVTFARCTELRLDMIHHRSTFHTYCIIQKAFYGTRETVCVVSRCAASDMSEKMEMLKSFWLGWDYITPAPLGLGLERSIFCALCTGRTSMHALYLSNV